MKSKLMTNSKVSKLKSKRKIKKALISFLTKLSTLNKIVIIYKMEKLIGIIYWKKWNGWQMILIKKERKN